MNPAAPILACFAVREEAAPFQKIGAEGPEVSILLTGIGRKNAEQSVRNFLETHSPAWTLTCGFAGGLNPELAVAEVIFETDDPALRERLAGAGAKPAKLFCAERIAITVAEKQQLRRSTGADAVEMESEAIRAVCRERGIPCATVRVISDTACEDLPLDFNALITSDRRLSAHRLALALLKSPRTVPRLLELRRNTRASARRLADVLRALLRALRCDRGDCR